MNIALYARNTNANPPEYISIIYNILKQHQSQLYLYAPFYHYLQSTFNFSLNIPTLQNSDDLNQQHIDLLVSLGGDGTLLETVSLVQKLPVPVLGINTGKLGFLTYDVNQNIEEALSLILKKQYIIEKRSLLELVYPTLQVGKINYALNEIVIHKTDSASMLYIDIFIDDNYLTTIFANGVIVSTPTGSTAYSLSCGGPILEPSINAMIITPIASHSLNARPIVISDQHTLSFKVSGRNPEYTLALDAKTYQMSSASKDEPIKIIRASHQFHLAVPHPYHFFNSLKNKLYWSSDKRI
ncbi:MAG: NAD(+)/NADH kinase [Bacteroidia bacterium]|nr:NAD(+)/NADH kinase [Bacteroidia bacterium]